MPYSSDVIRLNSSDKPGPIDEKLTELKRLIVPLFYTGILDFHPTEPWILVSTSHGQVSICELLERPFKTFHLELSTGTEIKLEKERVRCGKFVPNKQWIIAGTDSSCIYCYDYRTMRQVYATDTESGPIRTLSVHPTLSIFLICSEKDTGIRAWTWDKNSWKHDKLYSGHSDSVEDIMWHPENPNIFMSASLDKTVKIWNLSFPIPRQNLFGHKTGVTCLDYYTKGKQLFIVSGDNDESVKTWDYRSRKCVKTQECHGSSFSTVKSLSEPEGPVIVWDSERCTIKRWDSIEVALGKEVECSSKSLPCVAKLDKVDFVALVLRTAMRQEYGLPKIVTVEDGGEGSWDNDAAQRSMKIVYEHENQNYRRGRATSWSMLRFASSEDKMFFAVCSDRTVKVFTRQSSVHHHEDREDDCNLSVCKTRSLTCKGDKSFVERCETSMRLDCDDGERARKTPPSSKMWIPDYKSMEVWHILDLGYCPEFLLGGKYLRAGYSESVHYYDWKTGRLVQTCPIRCIKFIMETEVPKKRFY